MSQVRDPETGLYVNPLAAESLKRCGRCETVKPLDEFPRSARNRDGRGSRCNACANEVTKAWRAAHPNLYAWRRNLRLLGKYGLTQEDFAAMVAERQGACDICGAVPELLHVDHDHETGRVRGLLCRGCNTALGKLGDTPAAIRKVLEYLS